MCMAHGNHTEHVGHPEVRQQRTIGDFFAEEDPNTDSLCDELLRRMKKAKSPYDRERCFRMLQILWKIPKEERQEFHALYHSLRPE